jgi:hypothetical protein
MSESRAGAVLVELVDVRSAPDSGGMADTVLIPNRVRINGVEVWTPNGSEVLIHPITGDDIVMVALTVAARRVVIGAEFPEVTE